MEEFILHVIVETYRVLQTTTQATPSALDGQAVEQSTHAVELVVMSRCGLYALPISVGLHFSSASPLEILFYMCMDARYVLRMLLYS